MVTRTLKTLASHFFCLIVATILAAMPIAVFIGTVWAAMAINETACIVSLFPAMMLMVFVSDFTLGHSFEIMLMIHKKLDQIPA